MTHNRAPGAAVPVVKVMLPVTYCNLLRLLVAQLQLTCARDRSVLDEGTTPGVGIDALELPVVIIVTEAVIPKPNDLLLA